ncbi:hypothetical protein [Paracraurococcus lichenis]|uniref:Uncharacterized protein n=1 Tax=Paracraurococcus lichenis TaxID=3064888 RepID=A0ABT9E9Z7_9PROT|nr:hypothetical protein [Paracraurococcus sp. LOR1-02]MDO9713023.1 hypothetical protein [Paracraurococcus sp. LOR1-02]
MSTATDGLGALSTALVGQHAARYSDACAIAYFELGILLAHAGGEVPDWLTAAPRWACAAAAIGRSAARHRLRESRLSR